MRTLLSSILLLLVASCAQIDRRPHSSLTQPEGVLGKAIVFDAGSSGTRVFVYDFKRGPTDVYPALSLPKGRVQKIFPGLTDIPSEKIDEYLKPLFDFAKKVVGETHLASTPTYFAGTAGFRIKEQREPKAYEELIAKTNQALEVSGFKVLRKAASISGVEEATFAWLTVNALENRLHGALAGDVENTIGILEMGGASFQMAFLKKDPPMQNSHSVAIAGKILHLYAYSYGDLGENEGRKRFSDRRYCEWDGKETNFAACKKTILKNIRAQLGQECTNCGIGKIYQPTFDDLSKIFYALGTFAHLQANYGISIINAKALAKTGHEICDNTFETSRNSILKKLPEDVQRKACFTLAYCSAVLSGELVHNQNGIGFPADYVALMPKKAINSVEVSWTYGFLLLALQHL